MADWCLLAGPTSSPCNGPAPARRRPGRPHTTRRVGAGYTGTDHWERSLGEIIGCSVCPAGGNTAGLSPADPPEDKIQPQLWRLLPDHGRWERSDVWVSPAWEESRDERCESGDLSDRSRRGSREEGSHFSAGHGDIRAARPEVSWGRDRKVRITSISLGQDQDGQAEQQPPGEEPQPQLQGPAGLQCHPAPGQGWGGRGGPAGVLSLPPGQKNGNIFQKTEIFFNEIFFSSSWCRGCARPTPSSRPPCWRTTSGRSSGRGTSCWTWSAAPTLLWCKFSKHKCGRDVIINNHPVLYEGICQDCARVARVPVSGSRAPGSHQTSFSTSVDERLRK